MSIRIMNKVSPDAPMPVFEGFKVGADPELFVANEEGVFVCPEEFLPGTKEEPYVVPGGAVQVDGFAAEFNINPSESFEEFDNNIEEVLGGLRSFLPSGYTLHALPSMEFSKEVYDRTSDFAKQLGCSPDFNAWTGQPNPPPNVDRTPYLRTAAGHLHIGWTQEATPDDIQHISNCRDLVKQLDWYLGGWSISQDSDPIRRNLYGKAGACRYKPYGVEYRVLSNFWVMNKELRLQVWNRMMNGIDNIASVSGFMPSAKQHVNQRLIDSINNSILDTVLRDAYPTVLAA